jgi:hypothetical protein
MIRILAGARTETASMEHPCRLSSNDVPLMSFARASSAVAAAPLRDMRDAR